LKREGLYAFFSNANLKTLGTCIERLSAECITNNNRLNRIDGYQTPG